MQTGREKQNHIKNPLYKRKFHRENYHFHVLLIGDGGLQQGAVVNNISEGGMLVDMESVSSPSVKSINFHTGDFAKAFFVVGIRTFVISSKIVRISGNTMALEFHRQQPQLLELLGDQEHAPQSFHSHEDNSDIELVYPANERGQVRDLYAKYLFTYLAGALTAIVLLQAFNS